MNAQAHMSNIITAVTRSDVPTMRVSGRRLLLEHGTNGAEQAIRFAARFAASILTGMGRDIWDPYLGLPKDRHPPVTCARRIIAATANEDDATVDALVVAAHAHRYLYELVVNAGAVAGAVVMVKQREESQA
ncbi:hypothetical protein CLV30_12874 [Haloactinopolyspora alba]|uniref:Uncharacterized protein n=1 Tax=Haloactinopolyspora alba TaxID=648780 RepID=A0A2P8DF43_9ACTN|nr:hypothetical protein [Haloactinopolyspora alba]PSK95822.1 hypothetical protein CLV30_12874 [Haloactinopolyspora alba]